MIPSTKIQQQIANAIKYSGMTQTEIAKKLGTSQQIISCYANGQKMPALDTFANLCEILDLDANELLCIR